MNKCFVYIDGYNLYCSSLKKINNSKWLDLKKMSLSVLKRLYSCKLNDDFNIKYFTSLDLKSEKKKRQELYLEVLENQEINVIKGQLREREQVIYEGNRKFTGKKIEEKMTDVSIALHMYKDAIENNNYIILLISGDMDMAPALEMIKELNKDIKIITVNPCHTKALSDFVKNNSDKIGNIIPKDITDSQFKPFYKISDKVIIKNPFYE